MSGGDTIFALASGAPPAAVAIIRISGPGAADAAGRLLGGRLPPPRRAGLRTLKDQQGERLDSALVLHFPAPRSFTGEDMVELQVTGSAALVTRIEALLGRVRGCRPARPGEFARRAFAAGKLDLTQAEGLAALVEAETEAQRKQALMGADGALRRRAESWRERLLDIRADIEAALDFAEDEEDVAARLDADRRRDIGQLAADIRAALSGYAAARRIRRGIDIAIIGPPNAGKSTLLNRLADSDVAIVAETAGTTRDAISVPLDLGGYRVNLIDTAGLRDSADPVEQEGVRRARERAAGADLVVYLSETGAAGPAGALVVRSKADLGRRTDTDATHEVSALSGSGIDELVLALGARVADIGGRPASLVVTERQAYLLGEAGAALERAGGEADLVLAAEALRQASDALGRLTGHIAVEDMLDAIFSRFCIGK